MALHTTTRASAALRGSERPTAHLTLLPSPAIDIWRSEEADIEAIAFMDETVAAMDELLTAELDRDVPSMVVLHLAGRTAFRAAAAKAEILRLRGNGGAA